MEGTLTVCWRSGVWTGCTERHNSVLCVPLGFLVLEEDSYPQTPRLSGSIFAPQRSKEVQRSQEYGALRGTEMQAVCPNFASDPRLWLSRAPCITHLDH